MQRGARLAGWQSGIAAGNAGIAAATNDVIAAKQLFMLLLVYTVVIAMVFLTFRNLKAVICIIVPLSITSMLCEAVMAKMGIGIKVATLPVIALGVGIGVDYGIYIYSRLEHYLLLGYDLRDSYTRTIRSAGRAVTFTGLTLSAGVMTWVFSPLKFQADMGILLMFMFLWNMVGALTLLPALAVFLFKQPADAVSAVEAFKKEKYPTEAIADAQENYGEQQAVSRGLAAGRTRCAQ